VSAIAGLLLRNAPATLAGASVAALATALGSQYLGGLPPCELCHWQRVPYVAVVALGGAALLSARWARVLVGLIALVLLAGGALAFYHVGVEQGWFEPPAACSADFGAAKTVEELRRMVEAAPIARCTDVAWSLFGISLAGYNLIASLALAAFGFVAVARGGRMASA
jgi:disulfide bond formation protein DsbB